jgi:hypothetical protein
VTSATCAAAWIWVGRVSTQDPGGHSPGFETDGTQKELRTHDRPELAPATRRTLLAGRDLVARQDERLDPGAMITLCSGGGVGLVEHGGSWNVRLLLLHYAARRDHGSAQSCVAIVRSPV